jgi:hypothetical protein
MGRPGDYHFHLSPRWISLRKPRPGERRRIVGFQFGNASVQFDDSLLLIEPEAAKRYEVSQSKPGEPSLSQPGELTGVWLSM